MQVIVLDEEGTTVFIFDHSDDNGGRFPEDSTNILIVRNVLKDALEFLDDNTGRSGRAEVNE